jgi:GDP-D-mannose dehydratase
LKKALIIGVSGQYGTYLADLLLRKGYEVYGTSRDNEVSSFSVSIALHAQDTHLSRNFEWRDVALIFNVVNADKPLFVGTSWLPVEVDTRGA